MKKGENHSEESKRKMSESHKKAYSNPELKKKLSQAHKGIIAGMFGKHHTEKSKRKMSEALKGLPAWNKGKHTGLIPWNKGKHYSEEVKIKISETTKKAMSNLEMRKKVSEAQKKRFLKHNVWNKGTKGLMKPNKTTFKKGRITWNKGKSPTKETIEKQKKTMRGVLFSKPEVREHYRNNILRQYELGSFPKQENTLPERKIKEELIKRGYKEGIDFIHQYKFMNKFMCDFCFPKQKVIVEVYGDFWHANPDKYPVGSTLHKHQIKDIGRDKSKEAYITKVDNYAWTYLVLWETDIKKDVVECFNKIKEALNIKEPKHPL